MPTKNTMNLEMVQKERIEGNDLREAGEEGERKYVVRGVEGQGIEGYVEVARRIYAIRGIEEESIT
uniref:Uncharacterized protein n=1 Tax=Nelumbo nucifera TaxID=4432 RepID=A0A822YQB4_NELNU|nr:TPA_asm: hypothetical protein HUJ06_012400 [Nelumbo nucifera]